MLPKINSAHGSDTRNIINRAIELLNRLGVDVQSLVADGQLTPSQYAELIREVNGLISKGEVKPDDLSPELLELINNSDGVPFNILSIPRDGSVTKNKTTFIKSMSSNIFDKSKYTPNATLNEGETVDNNSNNVSDFIPVEQDSDYTLSGYDGLTVRVSLYDGNKNHFLSLRNHAINELDAFTFNTREAAYIRFSYPKTSSATLMLNKGDNPMPYEEYRLDILDGVGIDIDFDEIFKDEKLTADMMDFILPPKNLLSTSNLSENTTMDYYGNLIDSTGNHTSDYIPIKGNTTYTAKNDSKAARVSFYDANKSFISQHFETGVEVSTFETPEMAAFLRININAPFREVQINEGPELLPYTPYYKGVLSKEIKVEKDDVKEYPFTLDMSLEGVFDNPLVDEYEDYTWFEGSTSQQMYDLFDDLVAEHPDLLSKQHLNNEYTGEEVSAYHYKPVLPESTEDIVLPKVFLTGGTHGHEKGGTLSIYLTLKGILEDWERSRHWELLAHNVEFIIIPVVNPYGWNYHNNPTDESWNTRWNSRGVDINRQFPPSWHLRSVGDATYGGEAPLTEIEALNVKQIFDENPDIDIFFDYHNFNNSGDNIMIWWPTSGGEFCERQGNALIRLMGRKWKKDFDYVPSDAILGYTDRMAGGQLHDYANSIGIEINGTFETSVSWLWHPTERGVRHNKETIKTATEAFTNLLIINLRELDKR